MALVENSGAPIPNPEEVRLDVSTPDSKPKVRNISSGPSVGSSSSPRRRSLSGVGSIYWQLSTGGNNSDRNASTTSKRENKSLVEDSMSHQFGTLFGVFLPCLQNILGVILFIRLPWIVGQAGILVASSIFIICVFTTTMTTLSMSALATNGKIPSGGPYAIVTQALGPELGGAVGVLFYLGTTVAVTLYVLGGVEAAYANFELLTYTPKENAANCENVTLTGIDYDTRTRCFDVEGLFPFDQQVISILSTVCLGTMVYVGMKFVSRISLVFLFIVFLAIAMMMLGLLLMAAGRWDPEGISPGNLQENLKPSYEVDLDTGVTPDYAFLIALFFPSVTGIMAGANRSGILKDPGRSIPKGTLGAIATTTALYFIVAWMFAAIVSNESLKGNKLIASSVAWPHPIPVGLGIIMSCVGAALQSLAGAPQLLKSMANDKHIGFLSPFGTAKGDDEPKRAIIFTTVLASLFCLAGNVNYISPVITMFFLAMYGTINLSCFISSYLKSPGFRPQWKYFHWGTALVGALMCMILMFVISVLYAFIAIALAGGICIYIRSIREKKEWGSAIVGFRLEQATNALLDLSDINFNIKLHRKAKAGRRRSNMLMNESGPKKGRWRRWSRLMSVPHAADSNPNQPEFRTSVDSDETLTLSEPNHNDSLSSTSTIDAGWQTFHKQIITENKAKHLLGVNWRPQIMVLCKLKKGSHEVTQPDLLNLAAQLKKGRGLIIAVSVLQGSVTNWNDDIAELRSHARVSLKSQLAYHGVRGFPEVVAGPDKDILGPLRILFQSSGIGPLQPNTIMLSWPKRWRATTPDTNHRDTYVQMLKSALGCGKAIVVTNFKLDLQEMSVNQMHSKPALNRIFNTRSLGVKVKLKSTIDVWWLIHDGGILVLLPYILQGHRMWRECKLRIFAITPENLVNQLKTEKSLKSYLQNLRIKAEVTVVPISIDDVKDIDQNRTVIIRNGLATPTGHASVLSADLFRPNTSHPSDTAEESGASEQVHEDDGGQSRLRRSGSSFLQSILPSVGGRSRSPSQSHKERDEELEERLQKTVAALETKNLSESVKVWTNEFSQRNSLGVIFEGPSTAGNSNTDSSSANGASAESETTKHAGKKQERKGKKVSFQNQPHPSVSSSGTGSLPNNITNASGSNYDKDSATEKRRRRAMMRKDKRLLTAKRINEKIKAASSNAALVVLNLPLSRKTPGDEFIEYTEMLTNDLSRVMMIRGNGDENVENFSVA